VSVSRLSYEVAGWGVGELVFAEGLLAWHELPRPATAEVEDGDLDEDVPRLLAGRLRAYFAGARESFGDIELELDWCTTFQRAAIGAIRGIPYGETATYGEVAALAGRPNAQRALGSVCAANRFAIIVPCHRIVAADGLGSYGSLGVGYKRRLLELEHVAL
jgi:methylated-DNA-[protein]-cysteine S-methyltransferase